MSRILSCEDWEIISQEGAESMERELKRRGAELVAVLEAEMDGGQSDGALAAGYRQWRTKEPGEVYVEIRAVVGVGIQYRRVEVIADPTDVL